MANNPFKIFGLTENATQNELYEKYRQQRDFYSNRRFMSGADGMEACEMLEKIEQSYKEANAFLQDNVNISGKSIGLDEIESAIKEQNYDKAQALLDDTNSHTSEWHYLQSVVFFQKGWHNDAKKQLEIAINLAPDNINYRESLKGLNDYLNNSGQKPDEQVPPNESRSQQFRSYGNNNQNGNNGRSYRQNGQQQQVGGCSACDCCQGMICADCCCECMGGDLISCC